MSKDMIGKAYWSSHHNSPIAARVVSSRGAYAELEFGSASTMCVHKAHLHETWAGAREAIVDRWRARLLEKEAEMNQAREMKRLAERLEKPSFEHWAVAEGRGQ